jgi:hypothetical protein
MIWYVRFDRWVLRQSTHRLFVFLAGYWVVLQVAIWGSVGLGFVMYHKPFRVPLFVLPGAVLSAALWAAVMTPLIRRASRLRLAKAAG